MIIQKILALLALLSSLTGCAGADAASFPPADSEEAALPYVETALPDGAVKEESAIAGGGETAYTEADGGAAGTEDGTETGETASPFLEPAVEPAPEITVEPIPESVPAAVEPLYTRFSPYSGSGALQPRDDYGVLLPYVGGMSKQFSYALWGLVTADGQVVTEPVYGQVKPYGPFLLLFRGGEYLPDGSRTSEPELTLCGKDGSWTLNASDFHHSILLDGVGMAVAKEDGSIVILADDGILTQTFSRAQLEPYLGTGYSWDDLDGKEIVYAGGPIAVSRWDDNSPYGNGTSYDCFLNPVTGDITGDPPAGFAPENGWGDPDDDVNFPGYQYPDRLEDIADGTVYYWGERNGQSDLLDSRGNVLMADFFIPGPGLWEPVIGAGLVGTIQDGAFQYAKIPSGEVVFRYPLSDR
ncbi:MAG: hypothetical protein IJT94_04100 [Oscillibacter sp.]|nr:hypothetical protein [Oscillibacter sp.]